MNKKTRNTQKKKFGKGLVSRIYKEISELGNKKANNPVIEMGTGFEDASREKTEMANRHMKKVNPISREWNVT